MKCPKCEGKGYKEEPVMGDYCVGVIREWCPVCKGSGQIKYEGDRSDISWERE